MPNWCSNTALITSDDVSKLEALKVAAEAESLFQFVSPVGDFIPDESNSNLIEANIAAWGVKWEADFFSLELEGNTLRLVFDTAWASPVGVYQKLHEAGFGVTAHYFEPGMGFAGTWHNGVDDCFDDIFQAMRDGDAPEDLVNEFDLEGFMDEMEDAD
jgi:hypothetical protein